MYCTHTNRYTMYIALIPFFTRLFYTETPVIMLALKIFYTQIKIIPRFGIANSIDNHLNLKKIPTHYEYLTVEMY